MGEFDIDEFENQNEAITQGETSALCGKQRIRAFVRW